MLQLCAGSLADTHAIASAIAGLARSGDVVLLSGEMGAGKTAFAQGFGRALGVSDPITSPTFTLVHSHPCGELTLHHADLYRLERTGEIADLALAELAEERGIVIVEWGEVVDGAFPDHLVVDLEPDAEPSSAETGSDDDFVLGERRRLEVSACGPSWAARWARLCAACEEYRC